MTKRHYSLFCLFVLAVASFSCAAESQAQDFAGLEATAVAVTPGLAGYFGFLFGVLALLFLVNLSVGKRIWAAYAIWGLAFLIWHTALSQRYSGAIVLDPDADLRLLAASGHGLVAIGFILAGLSVEIGHRLAWMRRWFFLGAALNAGLAACAFVLPARLAGNIFNVVMIASLAGQALPLIAARRIGRERPGFGVKIHVAIGIAIAAAYIIALVVVDASSQTFTVLNRISVAVIVAAGALMSIRRIFALRDDRERVLMEKLTASEKEAKTSRALLDAERNYAQAREVARVQRNRLAEASHDIKQPIASLRTTIDAIAHDQPQALQTQLRNAFDYLEQLASSYVEEARDPASARNAERDRPESDLETVEVSLFIATLDRMFRAEAEEKGLTFEVEAGSAEVRVQPLTVMRIVSNLVANAIRHTDQGKIVLGARAEEASVALFVRNSGSGLSAEELDRFFEPYAKGPGSSGTGLGLAIVKQLARGSGLALSFHVDELGKAAEFTLKLPLAAKS